MPSGPAAKEKNKKESIFQVAVPEAASGLPTAVSESVVWLMSDSVESRGNPKIRPT
jgi:hypothetical protein